MKNKILTKLLMTIKSISLIIQKIAHALCERSADKRMILFPIKLIYSYSISTFFDNIFTITLFLHWRIIISTIILLNNEFRLTKITSISTVFDL